MIPKPENYGGRMPRYAEAITLACVGLDSQGRDAFLEPVAARAWLQMAQAAAAEERQLLLLSAFRSVAYQAGIVQRKIDRGDSLDDIMRVVALPGHSEHHSGCAVDIGSPHSPPLTESFDQTPEFAWLTANAPRFGFTLSYPKNNDSGIVYEPWHWAHRGLTA